MRSWGILVLFILAFLLFKFYLIRGVAQATDNRFFIWGYGIISIGSLLIGLITMRSAFSSATVNMSLWQNIITAFMVSVIICEILLAIFFLADDIALVVQTLARKVNQAPTADTASRRRILKTIGLGLTAIPFAAYLYGITKGKYAYKVFKKTLHFPELPEAFDGFSIAQFSDFHSGSFDSIEEVKKGLSLLQDQGADLILFTGDLVNERADEVLPYKKSLQAVQAPFGKFSVLGNHDYPSGRGPGNHEESDKTKVEEIKQHHADTGFHLLNNDSIQLEKNDQKIRLVGVENWGTRFVKHGDLDAALEGCHKDDFCILLSHDPTHWEEEVISHPQKIHLTLAGHTHGLQMGIELPGFKWSPIKYIYQRWAGLYQEQNQYLYVNRGFGFIGFAGRVGIRPEITVLTLKKG